MLESIVHPLILENIENVFKTYNDEEYVFISVPLLFEAGWQNLFDKIVFIKTDDDIRLKRLIERNGYDKDYAKKRLDSQMPQDEKIKNAHIVIENNGSLDDFHINIEKALLSL